MLAPRTFRKKPVKIKAIQWTGSNSAEIEAWVGTEKFKPLDPEDAHDDPDHTAGLFVDANSRWLGIATGEWIIRDSAGFYPCKPDIFAATYEEVPE